MPSTIRSDSPTLPKEEYPASERENCKMLVLSLVHLPQSQAAVRDAALQRLSLLHCFPEYTEQTRLIVQDALTLVPHWDNRSKSIQFWLNVESWHLICIQYFATNYVPRLITESNTAGFPPRIYYESAAIIYSIKSLNLADKDKVMKKLAIWTIAPELQDRSFDAIRKRLVKIPNQNERCRSIQFWDNVIDNDPGVKCLELMAADVVRGWPGVYV